jgi:hypothetical protein
MMDFMILIKTIQFVNNVILNVLLVIKLDVLLAVSTELLLQNVLVKMVIIVRQEKMIKNGNFVFDPRLGEGMHKLFYSS